MNYTSTKDYDFYLPQELIAQTPIEPRDSSRLLCLAKNSGNIEHKKFYDIIDMLNEGDCLVLNDSRVLPARIFGVKEGTGAHVEFLLLESVGDNLTWECLAKPGKRAKVGTSFVFGDNIMKATVTEVKPDGNRVIKFEQTDNFYHDLDTVGTMPLPPYITESLKDKERYQTVYSDELGSAAAPTAGLHFTKELMKKIEDKGVKIGFVTLHVGLGTFRPVSAELITEHKMHSEHYYMPKSTEELINNTKKNGGRVIAVGTTSCRTVESVAQADGRVVSGEGFTDIFMYPGYKFKCIDCLITNFHLPQSTLLMLICALSDREKIFNAYKIAVDEKYRFFSFGDAMFIH